MTAFANSATPLIDRPDSALVSRLHPSPNIEARRDGLAPSILLLHYTGVATAAKAIDWLSRPESKVSCHYVIDEDGIVTQMVAEHLRAWHAGVSMWAGLTDVNSASIGIEIHNPGHDCGYPEFPTRQMQAVEALSRDILKRHRITSKCVLAHSDVAPGRKIDPGERFDWAGLAKAGVGVWVEPAPIDDCAPVFDPGCEGDAIREVQAELAAYGYGITPTGRHDADSVKVVAAFQRHFRQARVDGRIDRSTIETLDRLREADAPRIA